MAAKAADSSALFFVVVLMMMTMTMSSRLRRLAKRSRRRAQQRTIAKRSSTDVKYTPLYVNRSLNTMNILRLIIIVATSDAAYAFGSFGNKSNAATKSSNAKLPLPTLDPKTNRYVRSPLDDGAYPYDVLGSALRHGPSPAIARLIKADEYEQGVLKYMLSARCSRYEATGNVDAKLNNAADWAYRKMEEKNKGKPKVDYCKLDKKQAILTGVWALGITPLAIYVVWSTVNQFIYSPGPSFIPEWR